jgi:hypothetical protein
MVGQILTKEKMYMMYPKKWLLVNDPKQRESDGEILSGELLAVFDNKNDARREGSKRKLRCRAIISSVQEDI